MRARGFVTFRLSFPVAEDTAFFPIEQGTQIAVQRPGGLLRFQTTLPYAIVTGHSAVEIEVEALDHGSAYNVPPMNTFIVLSPPHLRDMNQLAQLDVHNAQGFIAGTDDQVERVRPVPDAPMIMGDAVPSWNDSMRRITEMEQARERQREDPGRRVTVDGANYYIDAQMNDEARGTSTWTLTSASGATITAETLGQTTIGGDQIAVNSAVWTPADSQRRLLDEGDWTTWFWGRGRDRNGEDWVWRIRAVDQDARPCPDCEQHARQGAELDHMVVRCALCRRQIMVVPTSRVETQPVAGWTREPTLREVWAD